MAKRARPDPAITERWTAEILIAAKDVVALKESLAAAWEVLKDKIRGAFGEGVLVGAIKAALLEAGLGLSGSRIYQIKFELRDQSETD